MRVSTDDRVVSVVPGTPVTVAVTVTNATVGDQTPIIEAFTVSLAGDDSARVEPDSLALFPDASGELLLTFDVSETEAAGIKVVWLQVRSTTTNLVESTKVVLDIAAKPVVALRSTPRMVRARRSGVFGLEVDNLGNVALDVSVAAPPSESGVVLKVKPPITTVLPGTTQKIRAVLKGPRMLTGSEVDRTVEVEVLARALDGVGAVGGESAESPANLSATTSISLRQRPTISRGLVTAVILVGIIGVWAAIFLFGLDRAFRSDEVAKIAPPSFFPSVSGDAAPAADTARTTFLPKDGLVAANVGGSISGTVLATSDQRPVGRVLVKAFRPCKLKPVAVAATQADGTYLLTGLFPTSYVLQYVADGYNSTWLRADTSTTDPTIDPAVDTAADPAAGDCASSAQQTRSLVSVDPQVTTAIDAPVLLKGKPGSVSGQVVVAGDDAPLTPTQVTLRPILANGEIGAESTMSTQGGRYAFTDLVAPATYQLTFSNDSYADTSIIEELGGGEDLERPPVLLGADAGTISGHIVDQNGVGLGGVTVSTTVDSVAVKVTTPTQQDVGRFTLPDLPTPATYVISASSPDAGTATVTIELGPGEQIADRRIQLSSGATTFAGTVKAYDAAGAAGGTGAGLGGVEITLGGLTSSDGSALTTTSLTGDNAGGFAFHDLAPGNYTLTFTHPDYVTQTQPIQVGGATDSGDAVFALVPRLGSIEGQISSKTQNLLVGATVTVTNGTSAVNAINGDASALLPRGGFAIGGLEPGWYSVTASADGFAQRTQLVYVTAGESVDSSIELRIGD